MCIAEASDNEDNDTWSSLPSFYIGGLTHPPWLRTGNHKRITYRLRGSQINPIITVGLCTATEYSELSFCTLSNDFAQF